MYTIEVTVEDSVGSVNDTIDVTVTNAAPVVAAIAGPTQALVNETAVYSSSFSDAGTLDTHTTSWVITDANNNIVASGGGLSIDFTPTTAGSYTVTFTVTDDDGGSASASLNVTVGHVALRADDVTGKMTLFVATKDNGGIVAVQSAGGGGVQVSYLDAVSGLLVNQTYAAGAMQHVVVYGGAGTDIIAIDAITGVTAEIYGGGGSDVLASGVEAIIVGGDGTDIISALHSGRNVIIGGDGADILQGNMGDDIMIAGVTVHDNDRVALNAIAREWRSSNNIQTRVNNLRQGTGLNGSYVLNAGNVFHDGDWNIVFGLGGRNWYLMNAAESLALVTSTDVLDNLTTEI